MAIVEGKSFDSALLKAASDNKVSFVEALMVRLVLARPRKRRELEKALTQKAMEMGALPVEATFDSEGVFTGNWEATPILDWIRDNWEWILAAIQAILLLF